MFRWTCKKCNDTFTYETNTITNEFKEPKCKCKTIDYEVSSGCIFKDLLLECPLSCDICKVDMKKK